ncbi:adenylate/guanylate cyclase domain-containing protein [Sulfuricurvum sp.]|uniref:adenylate/guanylate cyclase domain-containing protein n=1 Tax=Sulfuricurvum sp. TaxID=2025608 RepID=UPI00286DC33B|nr:adenylate/guanylate cyclase domain-containing protein [Sulfuricurvum sp.]
MQSNYIAYDYIKSMSRIDTILNQQDTSFEEVKSFPSIDKLTFRNGFYVYATALFVDIRDSSKLINAHNRPALAKIYRSFISEVIAIMNGNQNCKFINIDGDCVSGVYETPLKSDVDSVFNDVSKISSLIDILNCKLKKKRITEIKIGMGLDYGRLLLIKAGFSGSGLNEVAWMGDALNTAARLCKKANKEYSYEILVSSLIHQNLNNHNKSLLHKIESQNYYGGNTINTKMNEWVKENYI